MTRANETRKIRFGGIDAPENTKRGQLGQPLGDEAKQFVGSAIAQYNGEVGIEFVEQHRYGRWVSEMWLNVGGWPLEYFLHAELVANGSPCPDKQYWENCPNKDAIAAAEEITNQFSCLG